MLRLLIILSIFLTGFLYANKADVLKVKSICSKYNSCTFFVTIKHEDTGWKHFANRYEILTPDRKIIATRILHHPHVDEQPFTRSISNVKIPKNINSVIIRAHDLVHGYGGKEAVVEIQ
ncbi:hypothetical protein [Arcobacter sp. LA11]|uniref:hypothetical protein n=1 Tax=Arcobacter sp. LA11 TaxID=1898176 RepID=UPI000932A012|nr:hypothetical protein [Arcobacter sp. LA11]